MRRQFGRDQGVESGAHAPLARGPNDLLIRAQSWLAGARPSRVQRNAIKPRAHLAWIERQHDLQFCDDRTLRAKCVRPSQRYLDAGADMLKSRCGYRRADGHPRRLVIDAREYLPRGNGDTAFTARSGHPGCDNLFHRARIARSSARCRVEFEVEIAAARIDLALL